MNKDNSKKAPKSYAGEILQTMQKHQDVCWVIQISFFLSTKNHSVIFAKFQANSWELANFQKFRQVKETSK